MSARYARTSGATRLALSPRYRLIGPKAQAGTLALVGELAIPSHRPTELTVDANLIALGLGYPCRGCGHAFFNPRVAEVRTEEITWLRCGPCAARLLP